ncbi:hypothetical protein [Peptacetobacter hiranonis]|uniref:Uncharacterized protein n=1 Tax=Peptacetobacter hiranonis (strain DSM 13275 / JCM 10541 / KCTC 15199 / TO-931) TaxID=500633 RepID=B6FYH1_PEPHT|nr:hypothetical protein [Peptacetobacter hiranonis]EEA85429.1 hypothetical protein CLOHIR_00923 [Peptacetobacter hiranonis DSM 13275]
MSKINGKKVQKRNGGAKKERKGEKIKRRKKRKKFLLLGCAYELIRGRGEKIWEKGFT